MKRILLALSLAIPLFISSCKNDDPATPYSKSINGVNLTTIDASPMGSIGTPDVKTQSDSFFMVTYPTPCQNVMELSVTIKNNVPLTVVAKLVNVTFAGAPKTWFSPSNGQTYTVNIENKKLAGQVALTQSQNVDIAQPPSGGISGGGIWGSAVLFQFDVSTLPQGFYRVYIETSDGKSFWDNAWVLRN